MKERGEEGAFKLRFVLVLMVALCLLFLIPKIFVGHAALGQGQIPNIQGRWNEIEAPITLSGDCGIDTPTFSHFLDISQTDNEIRATAPPFIFTPAYENPLVSDFSLDGGFISQKDIYATFSYGIAVHPPDRINAFTTEFTLSDDCNSAFLRYNWNAPRSNCHGTGTATLKRENPTGCGYKCESEWTCSGLSACANGTQTKMCFDVNQCNKTRTSRTESQPCVMPAPPRGNNMIWYLLILAALLLSAITAIFLSRRKKEEKEEGKGGVAGELAAMIGNIDFSLNLNDRQMASEQYNEFIMAFQRSSGLLKDEDRQRLYNEGMRVYGKLAK